MKYSPLRGSALPPKDLLLRKYLSYSTRQPRKSIRSRLLEVLDRREAMVRSIAVALKRLPHGEFGAAVFGRGAVCAGVRRLAAGRRRPADAAAARHGVPGHLADRPVRPRRPRSICPGGTDSRRDRLRIADDDARMALGYGRHPERGSGTIVRAGALRSALEPRHGAGTRHAEPHRRCGRGVSSIRGSIRVPVRPDRAVVTRRLRHGAGAICLKLDRLALLLSLDDNTQLIGLERYHAGARLRPIVGRRSNLSCESCASEGRLFAEFTLGLAEGETRGSQ